MTGAGNSGSADTTTPLLLSVLEASFDAAFLVDTKGGGVQHVNKPALELFNAKSPDEFFNTVDEFISFWSTSLTKNQGGETTDEEDDEEENGNGKTRENQSGQGSEPPADRIPWAQVIQYAMLDNVRQWTVTGQQVSPATAPPTHRTPSAADLEGLANDSSEHPENEEDRPYLQPSAAATATHERQPSVELPPTTSTDIADADEPSSIGSGATGSRNKAASSGLRKRTSFPGVLRLTNFGSLWLVYIRHADHHDIIKSGSVSQSDQTSSARVRRSSRSNGSRSRRGEPRIIVDDTGTIVDIDLPRKVPPQWKWVTKELIGKPLSEAAQAKINEEAKEKVAAKTAKNEQKAGKSQITSTGGKAMLDVILENRIDPGHPAVPYSGFSLRPNQYDTAMTTANAIREESITEAAFEAALDPIFQIDEHGTIQMVNSAATTTFGWKRAEFVGSNISMICGGGHEQHHATYMARYLATGETRVIGKNRELIAKKKDGTEFPIDLSVVEVDTFAGDLRLFCGFVRDLSGIKAKERMSQEIVEVALDPMFQINQDGVILMVNKAALKAFGYSREELVGANVSIICGGSHGSNHDIYLRHYLRTGEANVIGKYRELPAKRKDGTEFLIQLAIVEIESAKHNDDRLFCGFIHDLSRQRRDNDIMRGTIDTSLDPVLHINENGIIQMVNNAAVDHLGYTREEMIGENVSLIVGGEHAVHHGQYIERYLRTGEKRAMGKKRRLKARRKDGTQMNIELGLSEILISGGRERMFCAFLTDLSSRQYDGADIEGDFGEGIAAGGGDGSHSNKSGSAST